MIKYKVKVYLSDKSNHEFVFESEHKDKYQVANQMLGKTSFWIQDKRGVSFFINRYAITRLEVTG